MAEKTLENFQDDSEALKEYIHYLVQRRSIIKEKEKAEWERYKQHRKEMRDYLRRIRKDTEKVRKHFNLKKITPEKYSKYELYSGLGFQIYFGKRIESSKISISGQIIGIGEKKSICVSPFCLGKVLFNRLAKKYDKFILFMVDETPFLDDFSKYADTLKKGSILYFHITTNERKGPLTRHTIYINCQRFN